MKPAAELSQHEIIILLAMAQETRPMKYKDIVDVLDKEYHANPDDRFKRFPSILVPHIHRSMENLEAMGLIENVFDKNTPTQITNDSLTNKSIAFQPREGAVLTDAGKTFVHALLNPRPQRARDFKIV